MKQAGFRCFLFVAMMTLAAGAGAQSVTPDSGLPATSGSVSAAVQHGNRLYIGGNFKTVGGLSRAGLAAIDLATGQVDPAWNPRINGSVSTLAVYQGKVYAGGWFTVNGSTNQNLAAFNLADGTDTGMADPWWRPQADAGVNCLAAAHHRLYIGGAFNTVNGTPRSRLAALDLAGEGSGRLDQAWNPAPDNTVSALEIVQGRIYAGGRFLRVNGGTTSTLLASFHPADGLNSGTVDARWRPDNLTGNEVTCLQYDPEGRLYVGGSFWFKKGWGVTSLMACNLADGRSAFQHDPTWTAYCSGTVLDILPAFGKVYVSGLFLTLNGVTRNSLAAFSPADGITKAALDPWAPSLPMPSGFLYMEQMLAVGNKLYVCNGMESNALLRFDCSAIPAAPEVNVYLDGQACASGTAVSLGKPAQGAPLVGKKLKVFNAGTAPLTLSGLNVTGTIACRGTLKPSLAPGEGCELTLELDTATTGTRSGQLAFASNDANEANFTLQLSGTVMGPPRLEVRNYDDWKVVPHGTGMVTVRTSQQNGSYKEYVSFFLMNQGGQPLTVSQPVLPRGFYMEGYTGFTTSTTIGPGENAYLAIRQRNDMAGTFGGPVVLHTSDPARPTYQFTIRGTITGVAGAQELYNPSPWDAGNFGEEVAGVPDVNGDGLGDVLVGAGDADVNGVVSAGRAYVFSGRDGALLHTLQSPLPQIRANFGRCVAGSPDLNGDGRGELIVSSPFEYDPELTDSYALSQGVVYVFSGADGSVLHTLRPEVTYPLYHFTFGAAVASMADMDKDGKADILVGSHGEDTAWDYFAGAAYVFSGRDGSQIVRHEEGYSGAYGYYGCSAAYVPDLDSDGRGDFVVGAYGDDTAYVYLAQYGSDIGRLFRILKSPDTASYGRFGWAVAGLPDVDWDGFGDVAVGAPDEPGGGVSESGRVYIYSPRKTGVGEYTKTIRTISSPNPVIGGNFGRSISCAGDMNGDSQAEMLIGAPGETVNGKREAGCVYIVTPATGSVVARILPPHPEQYGRTGESAAAIPDTDGDRRLDAAIGAPFESVTSPVYSDGLVYLLKSSSQFKFGTPAIAINTDPENAPWTLTDSTGKVFSGLGDCQFTSAALGAVTVRWGALSNHDLPAPAVQTLNLGAYDTLNINGIYPRHAGGIKLELAPAGAPWFLTDALGQVRCGTGNVQMTDLPAGGATLSWGLLPNHAPPTNQPQALTIKQNVILVVQGAFKRQTGGLVIRTWPESGTWTLIDGDGGRFPADGSGRINGCPSGPIRMTWDARGGYDPPPLNPDETMLDPGTTATLTGGYYRHSGRVIVNVTPASAGWTLKDGDGNTARGQGSMVAFHVPIGAVEVTLDPPPLFYGAPATSILRGTMTKDGTLTLAADYPRLRGQLQISPSVAGAAWSLTDADQTYFSGTGAKLLTDVQSGTATLNWRPVANYDLPAGNPVKVIIPGNQVTTAVGVYRRHQGTVEIHVLPAGAAWVLTDGDGKKRTGAGAATLKDVATGPVTIDWQPLTGYAKPAPSQHLLVKDEKYQVSGVYTRQMGSVDLNVTPAAAAWRLQGQGFLIDRTGSAVVNNLPTGTYRITFSPAAGYTAPPPRDLAVAYQQTTRLAIAYTRLVGEVQLMVEPAAAGWTVRDADGRQWTGQGSAVIRGVGSGVVKVTWSAPAGYYPPNPAASQKTLAPGDRVAFTGVLIPNRNMDEVAKARLLRYLLGISGDASGLDLIRDGVVNAADLVECLRRIKAGASAARGTAGEEAR